METDILTAIKAALNSDSQLKDAGVKPHAIIVSENGDITPSTPLPALAISSGSVTTRPTDMSGQREMVTFETTVHVYLEDFSRSNLGPEKPSLDLKTLCNHVKRILRQNKLDLDIFQAAVGVITFPGYAQRNYIDRWEGRVPFTYRWIQA
jgi:hypothetical protein